MTIHLQGWQLSRNCVGVERIVAPVSAVFLPCRDCTQPAQLAKTKICALTIKLKNNKQNEDLLSALTLHISKSGYEYTTVSQI